MNPQLHALKEVEKRIKDSIALKSSYNPFVARYEVHYLGHEKPRQFALKHSIYKTLFTLWIENEGKLNPTKLLKFSKANLRYNQEIVINLVKRGSELKRAFDRIKESDCIDDGIEKYFTSKKGKQNAKRITEEHIDLLRIFDTDHQNSEKRTAYRYLLKECKRLNIPPISYSSVRDIINDHPHWSYIKHPELIKEVRSKGVGIKPEAPLTMVMMDGTPAGIYYWNELKRAASMLQLWVVMDVFSGYVIGYYIDDSENRFLILKALEMAVKTTGYLPGEIKTDNATSFKTPEWKNFVATARKYDPNILFTKHKPGEPTGKSGVEALVKMLNKVIGLDPRGVGLGVKTKLLTSRKSEKSIAKILKRDNLPTRAEAIKIIEDAIIDHGNTVYNKLSARERYESVKARPYATPVELKEIVNLFWLTTKAKISPAGQFRITVKGEMYNYMLSNEDTLTLLKLPGKGAGVGFHKVIVKYDPKDMSTVHCYDPKNPTTRLFVVREQGKIKLSSREDDENKKEIMSNLYERNKMVVGMINNLNQQDAKMHVHANHFMGKEELHRSQEELLRLQFLKYNTEVADAEPALKANVDAYFETTVKKDKKFDKIIALE